MNIPLKDGTHAGALDDESLDEIWDHLDEIEDLDAPESDASTLSFLANVNGAIPLNTFVDGLRITRFLNFCND